MLRLSTKNAIRRAWPDATTICDAIADQFHHEDRHYMSTFRAYRFFFDIGEARATSVSADEFIARVDELILKARNNTS